MRHEWRPDIPARNASEWFHRGAYHELHVPRILSFLYISNLLVGASGWYLMGPQREKVSQVLGCQILLPKLRELLDLRAVANAVGDLLPRGVDQLLIAGRQGPGEGWLSQVRGELNLE